LIIDGKLIGKNWQKLDSKNKLNSKEIESIRAIRVE
jgi:hypothetical protein